MPGTARHIAAHVVGTHVLLTLYGAWDYNQGWLQFPEHRIEDAIALMGKAGGPNGPSRPTVKRLFAVSGNKCAFPECDRPLVDPSTGSIIGEICHIRGEKPGAKRYDPSQTNKERHGFDNLILLCALHHKIIDDDEQAYTVERLREMKASHRGTTPVDEATTERFVSNVVQIAHTITNIIAPRGAVKIAGATTSTSIWIEPPSHALTQLLRQCTVRVQAGTASGTGFRVAACLALTCSHVVRKSNNEVSCTWQGTAFRAQIEQVFSTPDMALLSVPSWKGDASPPCVFLDTVANVGDHLFCYGFSDQHPSGDSAAPEMAGWSEAPVLLKLMRAQVRPGFSGAPLLNRETGGVCGMMTKTRDRDSDLGGRAVPTSAILDAIPELRRYQEEYHSRSPAWIELLPKLTCEGTRVMMGLRIYGEAQEFLERLVLQSRPGIVVPIIRRMWPRVDPMVRRLLCYGFRGSRDSCVCEFLKSVAQNAREHRGVRIEAERSLRTISPPPPAP